MCVGVLFGGCLFFVVLKGNPQERRFFPFFPFFFRGYLLPGRVQKSPGTLVTYNSLLSCCERTSNWTLALHVLCDLEQADIIRSLAKTRSRVVLLIGVCCLLCLLSDFCLRIGVLHIRIHASWTKIRICFGKGDPGVSSSLSSF